MVLHLARSDVFPTGVLGQLFVDGVWQWWTLEPTVHVPAGRYRVLLSMSVRFKRVLPEILHVPGFTGIRIHPGNTTEDTRGCVLIGGGQVKTGTTPVLIHSRAAVDKLIEDLTPIVQTGADIWIDVIDPTA